MVRKMFETMVVSRLNTWILPRQYWFTERRGTVDALLNMMREVKNSQEKYVVDYFLKYLEQSTYPGGRTLSRERKCLTNLYTMIRSYFVQCSVTVRLGDGKVNKDMPRGCPPRSIGPAMWKIMFDMFLNLPCENGISTIANAVDKVATV